MTESLQEYFAALGATLRVADAFDILVVAGIVYAGISWFRQSRSRLVMSGLVTLVVVYFAAGLLEMHLTLALFQAGIPVAAVALVVIFQEEIRRAFERVALASRFGAARSDDGSDAEVDIVVEATATLANSKTGALIVLRGHEPLERHLTGGIALNGKLSEALLYSVFDASSAGHDGALVIENGLVTCFGAHLPLSQDIKGTEGFGTRHTAALGLSERSDALIVVVSEERGVISLAENGKLSPLRSPAELQKGIQDFKTRVRPRSKTGWLASSGPGWGLKVLSVAIAVGAWMVTFGYRTETSVRTLSAPIVFKDLPEGWVLRETSPHTVELSLSGPERQLENLESGDLTVVSHVDDIKAGVQRKSLSNSDVGVPAGIAVRDIKPSSVRVVAERTSVVDLLVQPKTSGSLSDGKVLKSIVAKPQRVRVSVPRSLRNSTRIIATDAISLADIEGDTTLEVPLRLPTSMTLANGEPSSVSVRLELANKR